jgi:thioredoxin reductase (NADPH)
LGTPPQIERLTTHGILREVQAGEVLVEAGEQRAPFFVVKAGQLEVVQPSRAAQKAVALFPLRQFTGESSILSGRRILVRVRAKQAGEVIEINHDHLLDLVQTDSELSEIFLRAFIHRRVEITALEPGDVLIIGSRAVATSRSSELSTASAIFRPKPLALPVTNHTLFMSTSVLPSYVIV